MISAAPILPASIHAPAKINLFLHITGKRDDGFHYLDSGVVFTKFGDQITIDQAVEDEVCVTGPFADILKDNGGMNICSAALDSFRAAGGAFGPVKIIVEKNIPIGAGLGGGSTDAAALLRYLNKNTRSPLESDALFQLALRLGADVPVCLNLASSRMGGKGEIISPLTIRNAGPILLANPGKTLATGDVFRSLTRAEVKDRQNDPLSEINSENPCELASFGNDLKVPACRLMPEIADLLGTLKAQNGADAVGMSGSGATCFAIHSSQITCEVAARQLLEKNIWAVATKII